MTNVRRRATVADVLAALPASGNTIAHSTLSSTIESRGLTSPDDALAEAVSYGMAAITGSGLTAEVRITDAGLSLRRSLALKKWDRAVCPLPHTYDLFVPGAPPTARTSDVAALLPAARNDTQTSIFAYHAADTTDYCGIEADRVNALAWTEYPHYAISADAHADRVTGYVLVGEGGARLMSAGELARELEAEHYGADVDPNEVVYVHLRGEFELRRVLMSAAGAPQTDDRGFIHFTTLVRLVDKPRIGEQVGEIHWSVDGRA